MFEGGMMVFLIVASLLLVVMSALLVGSLVMVLRLVPERHGRRGPVLAWPGENGREEGG